jgi:hypothetical protein
MCWTLNRQTNAYNVNKISALLQTTGGKDEPNIVLCGHRSGQHKELNSIRNKITREWITRGR